MLEITKRAKAASIAASIATFGRYARSQGSSIFSLLVRAAHLQRV
jgi:hypothetical protein